jgi:ElaB protein
MESNKNVTDKSVTEQSKTTGGSANRASTASGQISSGAGGAGQASSAPQRAREMASDVSSGVQNAYDQTVKAVSEAYDKTSEVLTNTYDQTMTYGRDNPGKLTLIAFGAGIGIGVLLASGLGGRRSNNRFTEPIVNALSQVALAVFK